MSGEEIRRDYNEWCRAKGFDDFVVPEVLDETYAQQVYQALYGRKPKEQTR